MLAKQAQTIEAKRRAVLQALSDTIAESGEITVRGVALRAEVSRQFMYNHPDLKAAVEKAARAPRPAPPAPPGGAAVLQGLRAQNATLAAKIDRLRSFNSDLRARNDDLESQRRRWLGKQVEEDEALTPERYADLRAAADRLLSENRQLQDHLSEARRVIKVLEADLRASREAHAEDAARWSSASGEVAPFRRRGSDQ